MRFLTLGEHQIPYKISAGASKRKVTLQFIPHTKMLNVCVPEGTPPDKVLQILEKKAKWIAKQYVQVSSWMEKRKDFSQQIQENQILFLGKTHAYFIHLGRKREVRIEMNRLHLFILPSDRKLEKYVVLKNMMWAKAKVLLAKRTYELALETNSQLANVRVKSQTGIWGSCSGKKNVNLNWHLIFLPKHMIDYVIIHELMHLREMNHSARFWSHVATYYPNYKNADNALKTYQWLIGIFDNLSD